MMNPESREPVKKIVICDDNQDILDVTETLLRSEGYQVHLAKPVDRVELATVIGSLCQR